MITRLSGVRIGVLVVGVIGWLLCVPGCGDKEISQTEKFENLLTEISESSGGRQIDIRKEVDAYEKLSDEDKLKTYDEWKKSMKPRDRNGR